MATSSPVRSRIEFSPRIAGVAVGDAVAITAFVVAGAISHGYDPVGNVDRVVGTLVPFLVGWGLASVAGGLYTDETVSSVRRALLWTVPAWVAGVVVAQILRATSVFPGNAAVTFALVAVGVGGGLLLAWRLSVALASDRFRTA